MSKWKHFIGRIDDWFFMRNDLGWDWKSWLDSIPLILVILAWGWLFYVFALAITGW